MIPDLFTVITLHGMPCGEVVSHVVKGDDYVATCKDGWRRRYRRARRPSR